MRVPRNPQKYLSSTQIKFENLFKHTEKIIKKKYLHPHPLYSKKPPKKPQHGEKRHATPNFHRNSCAAVSTPLK